MTQIVCGSGTTVDEMTNLQEPCSFGDIPLLTLVVCVTLVDSTHLEDGSPVESRRTHVDHAVARDRGRRRVVDVVRLEDDFAIGRHWDSISVGEGQSLVVIQNTVEILDPYGVYWAIQYQPDVLTCNGWRKDREPSKFNTCCVYTACCTRQVHCIELE